MKKLTILFIFATLIACKKNTTEETKNSKVLWAETVKTILPLERDTLWTEDEWKDAYKYDKEKIFSSITNAVLSGKLKAYFDYPGKPFSVKEFSRILVSWDSTATAEDPNKPGTFISAPTKNTITSESIAELKFNEKIELDTISYSLIKRVSFITFYTYKYNFDGNDLKIIGYKKLFDVKLNDLPENH